MIDENRDDPDIIKKPMTLKEMRILNAEKLLEKEPIKQIRTAQPKVKAN